MNIAYFGSPEIAATVLHSLNSSLNHKIALVVTQPDKPAGKKLELQKTKVKEAAEKEKLLIFDKNLASFQGDLIKTLHENDIQLAIVYAYGAYIPTEILNIPKYGFINVHFSLLPKYRGASPIAYPLILGDKESGVSLIKLNEILDGGDIISQEKIDILEHENRIELENRLTELSIPMVMDYIEKLDKSVNIPMQSQDQNQVTITGLIKKTDGYIQLHTLKKSLRNEPVKTEDLPSLIKGYINKYTELHYPDFCSNTGLMIYNYYRGLYKWPGIWTLIPTIHGEKRLKIIQVSFDSNILKIERVQLEGKNEVDFKTFNLSYNIF
jgi:methionyl-tRNA formyltransferase